MKRSIVTLLASLLSLSIFSACSTLPLGGRLPEGLTAMKVVSVDKGSPFALSPDGNVVAIVSDGLRLFHIPSKEDIPLGKKGPVRLAWSPHGYSLAAVFASNDESSIVVYDQHGTPMAEASVNARLTSIDWLSDDELIAGGVRLKSFKFGVNYQGLFFRWKPGSGLPAENRLRDATLRPQTFSAWKGELERGPMLDLSRQSPVVLYSHPADPPLFAPYYKLIIRDLESSKELEVASVAISSGGGRFSADGEKVLYGDGSGTTRVCNPWTEEVVKNIKTPGISPAFSPEGESWFSDGAYFRKDGSVVMLAAGSEAEFSRIGDRITLRDGGTLYQLSGMKPADGIMFVPAVAEKVDKLRSMRVQGLLTPGEYKESLLKITAP